MAAFGEFAPEDLLAASVRLESEIRSPITISPLRGKFWPKPVVDEVLVTPPVFEWPGSTHTVLQAPAYGSRTVRDELCRRNQCWDVKP